MVYVFMIDMRDAYSYILHESIVQRLVCPEIGNITGLDRYTIFRLDFRLCRRVS